MEDHPRPGEFVTVRPGAAGTPWVADPIGEVSPAPLDGAPTLEDVLQQTGGLTDGETIAVAGRVATALAAAHGAGVVHGALDPGVVVLSPEDGVVQVGGFGGFGGSAGSAGLGGGGSTAEDAPSPYLAPEQVAGDEADARSDLYALGCLMMTLLSGAPPAPATLVATGPDSSEPAAARTGAPWPSDAKPDVDPALNGLVHDLLAVSPDRRPTSAGEVVSRLGRIEADLADRGVVVALPVAVGVGVAAAAADLPDDSEPTLMDSLIGEESGDGSEDESDDGSPSAAGSLATRPMAMVTTLPWPWVSGSLAAVALVLVILFMSFGRGGLDAPTGAPGTSVPAPTSPTTTDDAASGGTADAGTTTTSSPATSSATSTTAATTTTTSATSTASPPTASPTASPPVASTAPRSLDEAISSLRSAVRSVVANGDVGAAAGQDLIAAADELTTWADRSSVQLRRRVSDLDGYVDRLLSSGDITNAGYQQVSGAISAVQGQLG